MPTTRKIPYRFEKLNQHIEEAYDAVEKILDFMIETQKKRHDWLSSEGAYFVKTYEKDINQILKKIAKMHSYALDKIQEADYF